MNKRYLIINGDDFGMCHGANEAIMNMYRDKVISSASVMAVCPWFEEAAEFLHEHPELDVGLHLTLTSEWQKYKWGPICPMDTSSLIDKQGYFYHNCLDFEKNSMREQVLGEIQAQLHKATLAGISLNNIDNHMGSLYGLMTGKSYLPDVFSICSDLGVGFRFPKQIPEERKKMVPPIMLQGMESLCQLAEHKGVPLIDHLVEYPFHMQEHESYDSFKEMVIEKIKNLKSGVSELYLHPSVECSEIEYINPSWKKRVMEYRLFYEDALWNTIDREGIEVIGWGDLNTLR